MTMSLEHRQARIERLWDRAFENAAANPVNDSNTLLDFQIRELLKFDPYVKRVWESRTRIVAGRPQVLVPAATVEFFTDYAKGIASPSQVTADPSFTHEPPWGGSVFRSTAVMYSGGSESALMNIAFNYTELIRVHHFFPHSHVGREFQLALVGLLFGYGQTNIGCAIIWDPKTRREYETSFDFVAGWNHCFYPYTIQYPLSWQDKLSTYTVLYKSDIPFTVCDQPRADGTECGHCWHCAERYFTIMALKTRPGFEHVKQIAMDRQFLERVQRDNRAALRLGDEDPWRVMTRAFQALEERYGITAWREGPLG